MANSALAGLMEAGSEEVATRSATIVALVEKCLCLCCEVENGFEGIGEENAEFVFI